MSVNNRISLPDEYLSYLRRAITDGGAYEQIPIFQFIDQYNKLTAYNPSFIFFPSADNQNKVYTLRPNTGSADFSFTGSNVNTYFGRNGLLQSVQNNQPLLSYDGFPIGFRGVTVEGSFTNFNVNNNLLFPTGSNYRRRDFLANEFGPNNNGFGLEHISGTFLSSDYLLGTSQYTVPSGAIVTYNTLIKNPSSDIYGINFNNNVTTYRFSTLTISSSSALGQQNLFSTIDRVGQNTYRISIATRFNNGVQFFQARQALVNTVTPTNPAPISGSFIIGLNTISVATSSLQSHNFNTFIPTSGSTRITKTQDTLSLTNISSSLGQQSGSLYYEIFYGQNGNNQTLLDVFRDGNNKISAYVSSSGAIIADSIKNSINTGASSLGSIVLKNRNRFLITYNNTSGQIKYYINGSLRATETYADTTNWNLNTVFLGRNVNGLQPFNGSIFWFVAYNYDIADEGAIFLTSL
ncbi:Concanavalin A-like lectin/glucanases superfamily [uncultured Caudovirales phage]|uniref:Concanavalin A-like lectin/glucanases superfamily n=1 Tax=uncultured Caudovirales phage TaxID=2100421 RepID=A0A6J5MCC4_9CAUD|nr:Concanavalin A-like lectin/glucanases superfamily [uncultured Caudovirales phage]